MLGGNYTSISPFHGLLSLGVLVPLLGEMNTPACSANTISNLEVRISLLPNVGAFGRLHQSSGASGCLVEETGERPSRPLRKDLFP